MLCHPLQGTVGRDHIFRQHRKVAHAFQLITHQVPLHIVVSLSAVNERNDHKIVDTGHLFIRMSAQDATSALDKLPWIARTGTENGQFTTRHVHSFV